MVDVTTVEPNLCKLRSFYLDEGSLRELRETTGNLRLAAASGANHEDVLGDNLGEGARRGGGERGRRGVRERQRVNWEGAMKEI